MYVSKSSIYQGLIKSWYFCSAWYEFNSAHLKVCHCLWLEWGEGSADQIWRSNLSEALLASVYHNGGLIFSSVVVTYFLLWACLVR